MVPDKPPEVSYPAPETGESTNTPVTGGTGVAGMLVLSVDFRWVYLFASALWMLGMIIFAVVVKTSLPRER